MRDLQFLIHKLNLMEEVLSSYQYLTNHKNLNYIPAFICHMVNRFTFLLKFDNMGPPNLKILMIL